MKRLPVITYYLFSILTFGLAAIICVAWCWLYGLEKSRYWTLSLNSLLAFSVTQILGVLLSLFAIVLFIVAVISKGFGNSLPLLEACGMAMGLCVWLSFIFLEVLSLRAVLRGMDPPFLARVRGHIGNRK